jgi:NhaP-type Na+/H+ or K+/H+ antiporter
MLPFLLFAGALHVDIGRLRDVRLPIAVLDTAGVALATGICGALFYFAARASGFELSLLQASCSVRSSPRPIRSRYWGSCVAQAPQHGSKP